MPAYSFAIAGLALAISNTAFAADYYGTDEAFAEESIYFVVTDRFVNGDTSNDQRAQGTFDIQLCPNGTNIGYLGGDFKGIADNADYIAEMGFTSLWITPIVSNPDSQFTGGGDLSCGAGIGADKGKTGYHGYWADNFYQVDEHWESADLSFAQFNAKMENEFGIKTVLDIVANHGSPAYSMPYQIDNFGKLYDENWQLKADHQNLQPNQLDSNNPLHQWYNTYGGLAQLSDLAESNPEVMDYLVGAYLKWIGQGVDAFRIDTIAWMPHSFWKEMSDRIRAEHPDFYMFGENFNYDAGTIAQHQKPENGGISVLDFPGKAAITNVFQSTSSNYADIQWYLDLDGEIYTNPYDLATFYDNHDMARMSANGNPNAFIDANNWLFTSRGIPVVYYGSEMMFMNGLSEHSGNRNYYGTDNINYARTTDTFKSLKSIANIRKNSPALQKGVQVNGVFEGQTAYFFRVFEKDGVTQTALVMLNKGGNGASFNITSLVSAGNWVDAETGDIYASDGTINETVDAHSVKVLLLNAATTNTQMLEILNSQPQPKVTVSPETLYEGSNVTVSYKGDANKSYLLHWGVDQWAGAGTPAGDEPMTLNVETGRYEATLTLPYGISWFDFVFHNTTDDSWDNNGGADWHYVVEENLCDCPPTIPENVSVTAGNGQVTVNWASASMADHYVVYVTSQTGEKLQPSPITTETSLIVSGLSNDVRYDIEVQAVNIYGASDLSATVSATPTEQFETNLGENATLHLTGLDFANWNPANTVYQLELTANNTWTTNVTLPTALTNTAYKLVLNGSWAVNWGGDASGVNTSLNRAGGDATVSLDAGQYVLTVSEGASVNDALSVSWQKELSGDPVLSVSTDSIVLGDLVVGSQANVSVQLSNVGGGELVVDDATASAAYLISTLSGLEVAIAIDTTGLIVGQTYTDNVTVTSNGGTEYISVSFNVIDEPSDVAVTFTCYNGSTIPGQSVYVVGSIAALGNWNAASAVKLDAENYPAWSAPIVLDAGQSFEWKCIKRDEEIPTQDLVWQSGANNQGAAPTTGTSTTTGSF
jgi:cyclomaltodextrin glucanotransferase